MKYTIIVSPRAGRDIIALASPLRQQVLLAIQGLAPNPRPPGCVKLKDRPYWRIRVRDYRIIYEIDDSARTITVHEVERRDKVYR